MDHIADLVSEYEDSLLEMDQVISPFTRPVTVRLPLEIVALIEVLSDHYKTNRSAFLQDMIKAGVEGFFWSLPQKKLMSIAEAADSRFVDDMVKQFGESSVVDTPIWRSRAKAYMNMREKETTS